MRCFILIVISIFSLSLVNAQVVADLKKINNSKTDAIGDQQEINRLQTILIQQFLKKANNPKNKIHKQIQDFFGNYKMNKDKTDHYIYPAILYKSNLSVLITGLDINWGLPPSAKDSSLYDGYGNATLNAVITIPIYDMYRRGYALNSISFVCKLTENVTYTEDKNNELPIEKLPSYNKEINLQIKMIDLDE